jgi:hypothetical protein
MPVTWHGYFSNLTLDKINKIVYNVNVTDNKGDNNYGY